MNATGMRNLFTKYNTEILLMISILISYRKYEYNYNPIIQVVQSQLGWQQYHEVEFWLFKSIIWLQFSYVQYYLFPIYSWDLGRHEFFKFSHGSGTKLLVSYKTIFDSEVLTGKKAFIYTNSKAILYSSLNKL